jgi:hypothetical protein
LTLLRCLCLRKLQDTLYFIVTALDALEAHFSKAVSTEPSQDAASTGVEVTANSYCHKGGAPISHTVSILR